MTAETQFYLNQEHQQFSRNLQPTTHSQEYDETQKMIFIKDHERDAGQTTLSLLHLPRDHEIQRGMTKNFNELMSSGGLTTKEKVQ